MMLFVLAFFLSCFFTFLIRQYALHKSVLDIPNHRSSHSIPTPRGGGLSVVIVFLSFLLIFQNQLQTELNEVALTGIILSSLIIAGIGFWDDHQHIPARWRIIAHLFAAFIALFSLPSLPRLYIFSLTLDLSLLGYVLYALSLVWLLNLYNFMDGIDGIASCEALSVTANVVLLLFLHGQPSELFLLLFTCVAGFLVWNYPHAKIFMGDACSVFLGFILGLFALITSASNELNLWCWLILLGVFICDASFTLIKRIMTGQVWYEAHRSHAYQHYAMSLQRQFESQGLNDIFARTKAHRRINFLLLIINTFWLFPLALLASFYPFWGLLLTIIAFLPLLYLAHYLKAGQAV